MEVGDDRLNFLDVTVIRNNELIEFNWYHKPTFSGRYLNFWSQHPVSEDSKDDNLNRQGSFRKLVPGSNHGDSPLGMSAKMIDRSIVWQINKQRAIFSQEYNILSE
ncbi:hypothetical protein ALC56_11646 [Trachymyrmex septentrionalis]|uniref:Uncharacterized protein n=1 Tax=Trachymyrmex septentrionalis TaxID=34720 RepID=A0A151JTR6_9HYME|nr:hypothetical protein ALC56_11646 [Trachymyrmex septentrionalis]